MTRRTSPTVRRRRLATELRRLRKESGKTREQVADFVSCSPSTITKIEAASTGAPPAYVARMLEFYGVDETTREAWQAIAKQARRRGWWTPYSRDIPEWFTIYVGLEEEASKIREYECEIIPGLLQTEDYIRELMRAAHVQASAEEADRRVAVRLKRQQLLHSDGAPDLWIILGEACLHREVGGREVMHEQLLRLCEISRLDNVTVQILPFSAGAHPSMQNGFVILGYPDPIDPDVVYVEYRTGSIYLEQQSEIEVHEKVFDHLRAKALSLEDSYTLIERIAGKMR